MLRINVATRPATTARTLQSSENHRRFADRSEQPRLPELVALPTSDTKRGILNSTREAVDDDRIPLAVDDVLDLTDHAGQPDWGQPALENGKLYPLTVFLADVGDALEPRCSFSLRVGDVVRYEDIH